MEKFQLTAEEWFLIRLLLLANVEEGKKEYLLKYIQINKITNFRDRLVDLQNKSVILKSYIIPSKGAKFDPADLEFNKNFLKTFYKCSGEMGQELFMQYPHILEVGGKCYTLNNITKGYKSMEDLCYDYGRIIKFNPETHKEILKLLNFGKEHNLITYGICEFIKSYKWLNIKKMKEDGSYVGVTFDTIQSI